MITLIVGAVALVGGFVFGVLFGRKNVSTVQKALDEANAAIAKLKKV